MHNNDTTFFSYLETPSTVPVGAGFGNHRHDLVYLLDTLDALKPTGDSLPPPYPLFIHKVRQELMRQLGYASEVAA